MKLKPYQDLLREYHFEPTSIPYFALLQTTEWWEKRSAIILRDSYRCSCCNHGETIKVFTNNKEQHCFVRIPEHTRCYRINYFIDSEVDCFYIYDERDFIFTPAPKHYYLHVHHTYYYLGQLPWQYEDESLTTLCVHCHYALHEQEVVPVFGKNILGDYVPMHLTPCKRCCGAGHLPEFDYYLDGVCFRCWGAKYEELTVPK